MAKAEKLSLLEIKAGAFIRWMDEEEVSFEKSIEDAVSAFLSPHKQALPPQIALEKPKKPTVVQGRFYGNHIEYNVASGGLSEVTEEYFDSATKPPIIISRLQLPVTAWTKQRRDQVIITAMTFLRPQPSPQDQ